MSTILKALRRLEEDDGKAGRDGRDAAAARGRDANAPASEELRERIFAEEAAAAALPPDPPARGHRVQIFVVAGLALAAILVLSLGLNWLLFSDGLSLGGDGGASRDALAAREAPVTRDARTAAARGGDRAAAALPDPRRTVAPREGETALAATAPSPRPVPVPPVAVEPPLARAAVVPTPSTAAAVAAENERRTRHIDALPEAAPPVARAEQSSATPPAAERRTEPRTAPSAERRSEPRTPPRREPTELAAAPPRPQPRATPAPAPVSAAKPPRAEASMPDRRESTAAPRPAPAPRSEDPRPQPTAAVERIDHRGLPDVVVERTSWHPVSDRRSAKIRVDGSKETLKLREGDAVGGLVVQEITPSSVLFRAGEVELRRKVGAAP